MRIANWSDLVIQGLYHVLGQVAGTEVSVEVRLHNLEIQWEQIANRIEAGAESGVESSSQQRLSTLEQKTEAIAQKLAKIEGAISVLSQRSSTGSRQKSYNYHPPQHELQAYQGKNLAKRLGVDLATLEREQSSQTPKDFERWCRSKDPGSVGWQRRDDGLYHPIK
ncbi:hypothetical protein [Nostoc sp. UHCC 0870]|uniref:hypothetical protein n=1 Tax=Nostoc sp. UHCC 0870 TaxID=2914041 RepID=UPI001EDCAC7F|nr:hypothetical protein [Nostoc sp. UHCC 0870]UKP01092.1 hypothetical protein L6494_27420 [Nostoc sp. UHCC 0870]